MENESKIAADEWFHPMHNSLLSFVTRIHVKTLFGTFRNLYEILLNLTLPDDMLMTW